MGEGPPPPSQDIMNRHLNLLKMPFLMQAEGSLLKGHFFMIPLPSDWIKKLVPRKALVGINLVFSLCCQTVQLWKGDEEEGEHP